MQVKMTTNLTTNFIFVISVVTLCYIQATKITVGNNENKKGVNNFSCLFGITHCLSLDYVFSHLSDCHHLQIHILILEGNYSFTLDSTITDHLFKKCPAISITGMGIDNTSIVCGEDAGFAFQSISQVKIANITFTNCGSIRNSTSVNRTSKVSPSIPLLLSTTLYFVYCKNVQILNVKVEKSNSTGVVMYNTYGNLVVEGCSFSDSNINRKNSLPSNGGFYIEFVYCDPGKVDENCVHQKNTHANYLFKSNTFLSNSAFNEFGSTLFYVPYKTNYYSFGRGGGLSIVFKGNASYNNVTIDDCTFKENKASRGGGLFVEFEDYSKNNSMIINNANFTDNFVDTENGTAGGGVSVGFAIFDQKSVEFNLVVFENCSFVGNQASWGGGFGLYMPSELNVINATNSLSFKNCFWNKNKGLLGSAVDLHYWRIHNGGVKMQVKFSACKFLNNDKDLKFKFILKISLPQISTFGTGALYANGIPIIFEESVEFVSNIGSALTLHDTTATFSDNCNASFINNRAWEGGAVALLGGSQMWIDPHTVFLFSNNTAKLRGGAIYALQTSRHDLLSGGNCFLRYANISTPPNKWNTRFTFDNNHAPTGSSIFATTLLSCAWGASFGDLKSSILNAFNWTNFSYDVLDNNTIATEVSKINIEMKAKYFEIIPGKCTALPITTIDDQDSKINRSLWLNINSTDESVQLAWSITDNSEIILKGRPNSKASLEMVTDSSHAVSKNLHIKLEECPPGYYFDSDNQMCRCSYFEQHLDGVLSCDSKTFTAKIKRGYWAGYHLSPEHPTPTDQNLVTGQCPRHYCKIKERVTPLPDKCDITLLNELLCTPGNRNGTLCGKCSNGYGVAINSVYFDCINCSHWLSRHGLLMYGLTEFVPLTAFVFVILYFDFNPHSGISSLTVLYFQIFTALNIYSDEYVNPPKDAKHTLLMLIRFFYNIWNLEFVGSLLPSYCIDTNFHTMDILCIKYLTGIYPFVLFLLFNVSNKVCCSKWCNDSKWCNCKFKNGLAALYTLVFTKFALLSGLILSKKTLSGSEHSKLKVPVAWLDGTLLYAGPKHRQYMILAEIILSIVLSTAVILLCYPFVPQKIKQCNLCSPLRKLCKCLKCELLIESFHNGYKDKFTFYAGLLFIYRISIVLVFCFTIGADAIFWITVITLVFLILTAIFQPYKNLIQNAVAVLCLSNIVFINLLSFSNLHYSETQSNRKLQPYLWIQLVLVLLPLAGFIIGLIITKIWSMSLRLRQAFQNWFPTVNVFQDTNDGSDLSSSSQSSQDASIGGRRESYGTF